MSFFYLVIALLVCLTLHEAAHAWAADKLGDPTARLAGRVSLNPLRHLDLIGTLLIFLVHFGWGKPVPFNEANLKNPKLDTALIALAGPMANLLTALLITLFLRYSTFNLSIYVVGALNATYSLSVVLFLFNLLPIAPLDGSKIIGVLIPHSYEQSYQNFLNQGPFILVMMVIGDRFISSFAGISPLGYLLGFGYDFVTTILYLST